MCSEGPVTPGDFCLPLGSKEISTKSKTILGTPGFVGFQVLTPYNKVILLRAQHGDSKLRKKSATVTLTSLFWPSCGLPSLSTGSRITQY